MKLIKFSDKNSENWGKEVHITAGGKWRKCTLHNVPLDVAKAYEQTHKAKGRKTEIRKGKSLPDGQDGYQLYAYVCKKKPVLQMASKTECLAAGVTPGPSNV
jgi:hypothetical protein